MMVTTGRFTAWVAEYVDHRRQLGYKTKKTERSLQSLADFMDREVPGQPLTDACILRWRETNGHRSRHRLTSLPSFVPWLSLRDQETAVSEAWLRERKSQRLTPYIYDPEEVVALMAATRKLSDLGQGFRRHTYATLLGLLASTGLRIGESLKLDLEDVDLQDAVLRVRESKGVPLRMVPIHESTIEALRRYAGLRNEYRHAKRSDAFFLSSFGRRLRYKTFNRMFQALRKKAGIPFRSHPRQPRIHDLRHTFATRHLLRIRREGGDMHCAVADLSTYLGHCHIEDTYWYLTAIPELMVLCGERFRAYVESRRQEGQS
jgi:integrase